MRNDFRIRFGYTRHRKLKALGRALGSEAKWLHLRLIEYCTEFRKDGDLSGLTDIEIEAEIDWDGEPGALVRAMGPKDDGGVGLIDGPEQARRMHDWAEEQPWVSKADERSAAAKRAAEARWAKRNGGKKPPSEGDTPAEAPPKKPPKGPSAPHADGIQPVSIPQSPNSNTDPISVTQSDSDAPAMRTALPDAFDPSDLPAKMTADNLQGFVTSVWRWQVIIGAKWHPLLTQMQPYGAREVHDAYLVTLAECQEDQSKPNVGLFLRILERHRKEATKPASRKHPPQGSEWAAGRSKEDAESNAPRRPPDPPRVMLDDEEPTDEDFATSASAIRGILDNLNGPGGPSAE